jgi:pyruvate formate lyase activating enzyme
MHHCHLKEGQTGRCRARKNENGKSVCSNYGLLTSIALDPIEKKPLARFYPGCMVLSVGSYGCNLDCPFCQNASIAAAGENDVNVEKMQPEALAELSEQLKPQGNIGVAFTYNEPMVGFEFVRDTAKLVRERHMKNVVVTNGSASREVLTEVLPYIDAFNIDLKGFTPEYYKKLGGDLDTVLDFIRTAAGASHVELTTLIVPGENDTPEEMQKLSAWVAGVDQTIPLHVTRFFPRRKMRDKQPTDIALMRKLADVAKENLETVLLGNV